MILRVKRPDETMTRIGNESGAEVKRARIDRSDWRDIALEADKFI